MNVSFGAGAVIPERMMSPRQAVVFYGDENTIHMATLHDMFMDGNRPVAGEGRPITLSAVKKLATAANEALKRTPEILPANVLLAADDLLVWWRAAAVTEMSFDIDWHSGEAGRERLQGVYLKMALPPLVFMLRRSSMGNHAFQGMSVYALERDGRPEGTTPLFRAPLLNINNDGAVCWGTGRKPEGRRVTDVPKWESLFFTSKFTHYNQSSPVQSRTPYQWLADFAASGATTFPTSELLPMKQSVNQVVGRHLREPGHA
jgi:PRTRC genetic system protein B